MPNHTTKNRIGYNLTILPVVDSSNNYAIAQINDGKAAHGDAFLALEQTKGKGQRGKQWHTGSGLNLALSIVLEPTFLPLHQQFALHTYICTSLVQYINSLKKGFSIKWPNDIYYNDRKAAGILIENIIKGNTCKYAIVGIGLNVNDTAIENQQSKAISLSQIMGKQFDLLEVANGILQQLELNWETLLTDTNFFYEFYCQHLYQKNKQVTFKQGIKKFTTIVQSVSTNGLLICGENLEYEFNFGEVEWVI